MLNFPDGEVFASAYTIFDFSPLTVDDTDNRLKIPIKLEREIPTLAIIDTAASFLMVAPSEIERLNINPEIFISPAKVRVRGTTFNGNLCRLPVIFEAAEGCGESIEVDATVFILKPEDFDLWGDLPTFLPIGGCLDRIRFAIDISTNRFYFGELP